MSKLTSDINANVQLFIDQTLESKVIWGLKNDEGWLSCDSTEFESSEVMPFWSDKQDALAHNVDEWSDFVVEEIPLDVFIEEWMLTLAEDGVLVGINWNENLEGAEFEPSDLAKKYQENC